MTLAPHVSDLLSDPARVQDLPGETLLGGAGLRLMQHEHRCRCGREFKCTAPSCVRKDILCVCCKLDEIERRHADRRSSE